MKQAFTCTMCGQCCHGEGGIVVSLAEQKRLSSYLNLSLATFQHLYTEIKNDKYVLKTNSQEYCIFFLQNRGCTVHTAKPDICRAWPFFRGNLIDQSSWEMAQQYCLGICRDVSHKEFVEQGLDYLHKHGLARTREQKDVAEALIIDFTNQV